MASLSARRLFAMSSRRVAAPAQMRALAAAVTTAGAPTTLSGPETPGKGMQDKLLFTPGPLTTSYSVKAAMLHDLGSRDPKFINIINEIRSGLLEVAGVDPEKYLTILLQGSGSYMVEAVLTNAFDTLPGSKLLLVVNGAYGRRAVSIAKRWNLEHDVLEYPENVKPNVDEIMAKFDDTKATHLFIVQCETSSGIVADVEAIGPQVHERSGTFIVDAMSCFGALPTDLEGGNIDWIVSSANKCIEGVPGFAFAIANKRSYDRCRARLEEAEPRVRPLCLDLYDQVDGLDANGQFRFTPPTHGLLAFHQALQELKEEGGVEGRQQRYTRNRDVCVAGLREIGFETYLNDEDLGFIISSFRFPESPNWDFTDFYNRLSERDVLIYPGKVTNADCFRIGHIGRLFEKDSARIVDAVREVSEEMRLF